MNFAMAQDIFGKSTIMNALYLYSLPQFTCFSHYLQPNKLRREVPTRSHYQPLCLCLRTLFSFQENGTSCFPFGLLSGKVLWFIPSNTLFMFIRKGFFLVKIMLN